MVVRVKKADDTQDAVHVVDSMLLPVGGVGQSHEVCPDILRFYSVFLKFHIDLELQLHTHSRVSVPFTHAVFLRAVGQRWLTHSLTYWKETFRHTGRNLPQNVPQLRSKSRDDSCLSRFGSRGSDDLQDAQRRFPAQTVLDLLNSERAAGLFHCHVRCLLNFQARGRKYSAVWINKSKSLLQWNMNILYILCDNVLWLIDAFVWIWNV